MLVGIILCPTPATFAMAAHTALSELLRHNAIKSIEKCSQRTFESDPQKQCAARADYVTKGKLSLIHTGLKATTVFAPTKACCGYVGHLNFKFLERLSNSRVELGCGASERTKIDNAHACAYPLLTKYKWMGVTMLVDYNADDLTMQS